MILPQISTKLKKKRNQFSCKVQIMNKTIATLFVIFFFSQGCLGKGFTPMEIDNHPCTPENLKVHCPIHWIVQRLNYYLCFVLLQVKHDFGPSKLFWSGPNGFGRIQIFMARFKLRLFWINLYNFDRSKMILT